MKLNLDFNTYKGKTLLRDWWKQVKAHFIEVQNAINELDTDITNEAAERDRVDTAIMNNLTDEISARERWYSRLERAINSEAEERERADGTLQDKINKIAIKKFLVSDDDFSSIADGEIAQLYNDTDQSIGWMSGKYLGEVNAIAPGEFKYIMYETRHITGAPDRRFIRLMDAADIASGREAINPKLGNDTQYGNIALGDKDMSLDSDKYGGFSSLEEVVEYLNEATNEPLYEPTGETGEDAWSSYAGTYEAVTRLIARMTGAEGNIRDLLPLLHDRIEIENNSIDDIIDLLVKLRGESGTPIAELRLKNSYEKSLKYPQASYLDAGDRISGLEVGNYYYTNEPDVSSDNREFDYDEGTLTLTNPQTIPAQSSVYFRLDSLDTSETWKTGTATIVDIVPRQDYIYFRTSANQTWTRLVKTSEIGEMMSKIEEITPHLCPPNARLVYCNGDHDELKLQAAIDELAGAGGGVVYPVGDCVVTAENVYEARVEGTSGIQYRAIIPIKEGITLDGSYCTITFKQLSVNTTAAKNCWVFYNLGKMRHVRFTEDGCSEDTRVYNPVILYSDGADIEDCTFSDIWYGYTASNRTRSTFNINNSQYRGNKIRNCSYRDGAQHVAVFAASNTSLSDNVFDTFNYITGGSASSAYTINIGTTCSVTGNTFKNITSGHNFIIGGMCSSNKFIDCVFNHALRLNGVFVSCNFSGLTVKDDIVIYGKAVGCNFDDINAVDDSMGFIVRGHMSNCRVYDFTGYGYEKDGSYYSFIVNEGGIVTDCIVEFTDDCLINCFSGNTDYAFKLAYVHPKAMFKNNIANHSELGVYDETSIVKDNILCEPLAGSVTLESDNEAGIIAGATVTAVVSNGESGNIEDVSKYYYWQKSINGRAAWRSLSDDHTSGTYSVAGNEKYIRCIVVGADENGAGAVYSGAYAVTAAETTGTEE